MDLEPAAERVDPVGQSVQAGPAGRVGAATAVVGDLDQQRAVPSRATRIRTALAPAYLLAFVSDSLTMKYAASSTCSGSSSAPTSSVTGVSQPTVSDSSALRRPRSESATGCSPRARSRSSAWASPSSSLGEAQDVGRLMVVVELALGEP